MGRATGPVPFTSYMTTPAFLAREPDVVRAFTRAVFETQRWLAAHGPAEVAAAIAPAFPEVGGAMLERIVARYREQETWAREPLLGRPGYDYLEQILLDGGFIERRHRYEDLVDTSCARQAMAARAPGLT
jgi:NitT/TauT family transport system substrate-binding protein